jgi:hypothetical protein
MAMPRRKISSLKPRQLRRPKKNRPKHVKLGAFNLLWPICRAWKVSSKKRAA